MAFVYFFGAWLIVAGIGFGIIKLVKFIIGFPKRIKKRVRGAVDDAIDRAFERNPQQITVVEERNTYVKVEEKKTYNDIKILNQK